MVVMSALTRFICVSISNSSPGFSYNIFLVMVQWCLVFKLFVVVCVLWCLV